MGVGRIGAMYRSRARGMSGATSVSRVYARQLVLPVNIVSFFGYLIGVWEVYADVAVVVGVVAVV